MREIRTTTIDGVDYRVRQLGVESARSVMARAARSFPGIFSGEMFSTSHFLLEDFGAISDMLLSEATAGIVDPHNPGRVTHLPLKDSILDQVLGGKPHRYLELVAFAWKANNFNEVFPVVVGLIAGQRATTTSESPKEATGSSTASSSPPG